MKARRQRVLIVVLVAAAGIMTASCTPSPSADGRSSAVCSPTPGSHGAGSPGAGPASVGQVTLGPGMELSRTPETLALTGGHPLRLSGIVSDRRCRPLSGAVLQVWHTNTNGEYGPGMGTSQLRCCYLQGAVETDASGRYQIETIMPGHYKGETPPPPVHIHFWVSHPTAPTLSTELNFARDPNLPRDAKPVITVHDEFGVLQGSFDIVLS